MDTSEAGNLRDEALRKIGRNVVNLQKLERALKILVVGSDLNGRASELKDVLARKVRETERQPMGHLVSDFLDLVYSPLDADPRGPDDLSEAWMSIAFRIEGSEQGKKAEKAALLLVVKERNQLIHKMLGQFDSASVESCRQLIDSLDSQHERMMPQFHRVMKRVKFLVESHRYLVEALESGRLSIDEPDDVS